MTKQLTDDRIEELLSKAYENESKIEDEEKKRPTEPTSNDTFQVLNTKRDESDLTILLAYNIRMRASNVVNHFVLDTDLGSHVLAGITFVDGVYEHLDDKVSEDTVLKEIP